MTIQITGNDAQFNKDITILGDLEIYGSIKSKTNNFVVKTNETERLRITNDGKVGIGIKNPTVNLHSYHATTNTVAKFESGDSSVIIRFKDGDTTNEMGIGALGNDFIVTAASGGERLRITNTGKVGIGTDNPIGTVDIVNSGADANDLNSLGVQINAAWIRIGDVDATGKTFSNGLGVKFYDQGPAHWSYGILEDDFLIANTSLDGNKLFPSNRTAPFIIKYDGKVGIGTENPSHLLHLQSASSPAIKLEDTTNTCVLLSYAQDADAHVGTYSDHDLIFDTDSTEKLRIRSDGNVNIVKDLNVTGIVTATSFSGVGAFVSGMIILWSGAADAIPSGFVLCDGNNSTPNLTDRFIVGAGSGYAVNATGGSADATLPSHYHNYPGDDQLTAANGKSGGTQFGTTPTWSNTFDDSFNYDATSTLTGGAKLWRTTTVGESVTNKNLPPYYALCYIMKT